MATKKVIQLHLGPKPFSGFSDLYPKLSAFLDTIKNARPGPSVTTPPSSQAAKLGMGSTTTSSDLKSARATAYGTASNGTVKYGATPPPASPGQAPAAPTVVSQTDGAKQVIQKLVQTLTDTQVGYLSGIGFSGNPAPKAPPTLTSHQNDVVGDVYSAWDASAGAYMKGDNSTGDSKRSALKTRLGQYDTAIRTLGKTAVPKVS